MDYFTRRSFLTSAITSAALASTGLSAIASPPASRGKKGLHLSMPPGGYAEEAKRITQATITHFWDDNVKMFRAPVLSAEAVPSDPLHNFGYVFWPCQIALHSLVEGAKNNPKKYAAQIWKIHVGAEKYYNPTKHAYNAWLNFPNNNDAYYDDNAWAVITLAEAYMATKSVDPGHAESYRTRAVEIMANFVYGGWDNTGKPGGMRWGTDPTKAGTGDKTVSATAGAALAALTLAKAGWNAQFNIGWAADVLSWLWTHLRDPKDNLILDGFHSPDWKVMPTKWTYNTGVTMRAFAEHYRLSKSPGSLNKATLLAKAALDHRSRMYDGLVSDPDKRFYYDGTYFIHFLLDGLLQVSQITPDHRLAAALIAEGKREANYCYTYIRDPKDGFYWRNWRLWRIGPDQLAVWENMTGQTQKLETDSSEKSNDGKQFVKTLLANASASRLFWIASRF